MESDIILPQPMPPPQVVSRSDESMWSAFQNILTFISLAFFAGALHVLWSSLVNYWVPATTSSYYGPMNTYFINGSIAALVVSAPFFITLFIITNLKYIQRPELKNARSKKTLNYITLIITFIILITRTISAITTALNDAFTFNFSLNLLVTLVITGLIFTYYLYEVRFEKHAAALANYIAWAVFIGIVTAATFIAGLYVRGKVNEQMRNRQNTGTPAGQVQPVTTPSAAPVLISHAINLPSAPEVVEGIEFTITEGKITRINGEMVMDLTLVFSAIGPCTMPDETCQLNIGGVQVTDSEGFKIDQISRMDEIHNNRLKKGEKVKGKLYLSLPSISKQYYLTYRGVSGVSSQKVEIYMLQDNYFYTSPSPSPSR